MDHNSKNPNNPNNPDSTDYLNNADNPNNPDSPDNQNNPDKANNSDNSNKPDNPENLALIDVLDSTKLPPPTDGYAPPPDEGCVPITGDIKFGYYGYYPEAGSSIDKVKGFGFTDKSVRREFIRKVYIILMMQLVLTFGIIALFVYHEPTKIVARENPFILWTALIVFLVTIITMACFESARRTVPINMIILFIFTLADAISLSYMCLAYRPEAVMMAVGITGIICLALTLFALQTKWDFTGCGGSLLVLLVVFVLFGLIKICLPMSRTLDLVCASGGALIFSFILIYDTQLMIDGDHKCSISPEEYVFAALNIYLDVINIFTLILKIFGKHN